MESKAPRVGALENKNAGETDPCTGTLYIGCPRGGVMVSFGFCETDSHGSIDGCVLKSVNQLQAVNATGMSTTAATRLARTANVRMVNVDLVFTTHLYCSVLPQQRFGLFRLGCVARNENTEVSTGKAGIIARSGGEARDAGMNEHAGNGGQ